MQKILVFVSTKEDTVIKKKRNPRRKKIDKLITGTDEVYLVGFFLTFLSRVDYVTPTGSIQVFNYLLPKDPTKSTTLILMH